MKLRQISMVISLVGCILAAPALDCFAQSDTPEASMKCCQSMKMQCMRHFGGHENSKTHDCCKKMSHGEQHFVISARVSIHNTGFSAPVVLPSALPNISAPALHHDTDGHGPPGASRPASLPLRL